MNSLENKVTLITGGANGIGAETAKQFLKERVKFVAVIDINQSKGSALEEELRAKYGKEKITFFNCDITIDDQLLDVFHKVLEEHETIDVVLNNAGIANEGETMYKKQVELNFTALVTSTLKALEVMRKDKGGKGGTIINVSSIAALGLHSPHIFIYSAVKNAVLHFSTCIGMDKYFQHTNVRVLTICFGCTDTEIMNNLIGIDKITNDSMNNSIKYIKENNLMQTAESAAKGLVQSLKAGKSGSTWLVENNRVCDITENIKEGYKIIEKDTSV